jgi:coenzyme PQQ biosynthesis protein PqqD
MTSSTTPRRAPDLIWRELEDGTVVVAPDAGMVRAFNETGSLIWSLVDGQNDVAAIVAEVQRQFDLGPEQAEHDVRQFLSELANRDLIFWTEPA